MTPWPGGKKPPVSDDHAVRVQWANGDISRWTHKPSGLRWTRAKGQYDFDIVAYEIANKEERP